ncbi:MAG: hypothetical protein JRF32_08700 [Deltaproteobacteria bacterium]|nr:hypothetical protein [Deltaproteobacteria bacterium]
MNTLPNTVMMPLAGMVHAEFGQFANFGKCQVLQDRSLHGPVGLDTMMKKRVKVL